MSAIRHAASDYVAPPLGDPDAELLSDSAFQCPHALYARLREEAPVQYHPSQGFWLVTRMADVREVLLKPDIYSNEVLDLVGMGPAVRRETMPSPALLFTDPPLHSRTRAMVDRAFVGSKVRGMEESIRIVIDGLIDDFIGRGHFEAMAELAIPVPIIVIARQLDVPQSRTGDFKRWSDAVANSFNPVLSTEEREMLAPTVAELNRYLLTKRAEKLAAPTEDIITHIGTARAGARNDGAASADEGERLSDGEYLTVAQQLVVGGNENTTAAILSCLNVLARSPRIFAALKASPNLIRNFIEEVLRLESPASGFVRRVTQDTVLGDVSLAAGSIVHVRYASANRDPEQFDDPDKLVLDRRNIANHVAFGAGVHICIGQMLARKELTILLETICQRFETLSHDDEHDDRYRPMFNVRSLGSLHLKFTTADLA